MWPEEALEFLRELEDNDVRDWSKANRARIEHLKRKHVTVYHRTRWRRGCTRPRVRSASARSSTPRARS